MKKRYRGSYTVEMAYIMAVFCLVMVILIQNAYRIHDETKSGMNLQAAVERARHDEEKQQDEPENKSQEHPGLLFSMDGIEIQLKKRFGRITGTLSGKRQEGAWNLEISERIYEPEEFLRKVAALKQLEERNERQIQEGTAP